MRAYIVDKIGSPFREAEIPQPRPAAHEVLVQVCASGLNPLDSKIRAGKAEHAKQPLPATLGIDMAGIVAEVGAGVTKFKPGDEVFGMVGGVGGRQGTLAEFVAAEAALLAHKPKLLTMKEAAALPLAAITAWEGLVDRAAVQPGQNVLVHAGAGGVGYVATQIALARGARVFATVSEDKKSVVEEAGATAIGRQTPLENYLAEHTQGEGFDIVFDTVGGAVLDASFAAVRRYTGHVVSALGWGTHSLAPLSFRGATYSGVFTLFPLLSGSQLERHGNILKEVAALADRRQLKPLLAKETFRLAALDQAYDAITGGILGKVVVEHESCSHENDSHKG